MTINNRSARKISIRSLRYYPRISIWTHSFPDNSSSVVSFDGSYVYKIKFNDIYNKLSCSLSFSTICIIAIDVHPWNRVYISISTRSSHTNNRHVNFFVVIHTTAFFSFSFPISIFRICITLVCVVLYLFVHLSFFSWQLGWS